MNKVKDMDSRAVFGWTSSSNWMLDGCDIVGVTSVVYSDVLPMTELAILSFVFERNEKLRPVFCRQSS